MDQKYYLNLNNQFRDVQLSWIKKLQEMKCFISMVEEYQAKNPSSDLSELQLPVCIHAVKEMVRIHLDDPEKRHVFIRGNNGKYLSGENGEHPMRCDRNVPLGWEKFIIEEVQNGKIALKSMNKYVSSEDGREAMTCNRWNADAWEFFEMIEHGNGMYSFKGNNEKFVSSENGLQPITCWGNQAREWEKFFIQEIPSQTEEVFFTWKLFNEHFITLCNEYASALTAKKDIEPENYFFAKAITVQHEGNGYIGSYETYHQERHFDQDRFKKDMKKADDRASNAQWCLNEQYHFLFHLLENENNREKMVSKMYSKIYPAKAFLESNAKKEGVETVEVPEEEIIAGEGANEKQVGEDKQPIMAADQNLIPSLDDEDSDYLVY